MHRELDLTDTPGFAEDNLASDEWREYDYTT